MVFVMISNTHYIYQGYYYVISIIYSRCVAHIMTFMIAINPRFAIKYGNGIILVENTTWTNSAQFLE